MLIMNMFAKDNSWLTQILGLAKDKDISFYVLEEAIGATTFFVRFIKDYTKETVAFRNTLTISEEFLNSATDKDMVTIVGYDHSVNKVVMVFDVTEKDFREVVLSTIANEEQMDLDTWDSIPARLADIETNNSNEKQHLKKLIQEVIPWYRIADGKRMPGISADGTVYTYSPFNTIGSFKLMGRGYNDFDSLLAKYKLGTSNTAELLGFYFAAATLETDMRDQQKVFIDIRCPDKSKLLKLDQQEIFRLFTEFNKANIEIVLKGSILTFSLLQTK